MSKKLPFSRSLCPSRAAPEREQNSVDSKISAGAPGLGGTGKRSGKGARFPSAWREQALVSGISMGRGKQISPFKANHAALPGTHCRQCSVGSGAGGKGLGGHGQGEENDPGPGAGSRAPALSILPPRSAPRRWGLLSIRNSLRRSWWWRRWGTQGCFSLRFVSSSEMHVALPSPPSQLQLV